MANQPPPPPPPMPSPEDAGVIDAGRAQISPLPAPVSRSRTSPQSAGLCQRPAPIALPADARKSRTLRSEDSRRGAGGRRRAVPPSRSTSTPLLRQVRRMLNGGQMPPQRRSAPRRCSIISATNPAPQDRSRPFSVSTDMACDAVEPWSRGCCARPARLRPSPPGARRRTWFSWSTCRDRWTSRTSCRFVNVSLALLADRLNTARPRRIVV